MLMLRVGTFRVWCDVIIIMTFMDLFEAFYIEQWSGEGVNPKSPFPKIGELLHLLFVCVMSIFVVILVTFIILSHISLPENLYNCPPGDCMIEGSYARCLDRVFIVHTLFYVVICCIASCLVMSYFPWSYPALATRLQDVITYAMFPQPELAELSA